MANKKDSLNPEAAIETRNDSDRVMSEYKNTESCVRPLQSADNMTSLLIYWLFDYLKVGIFTYIKKSS